MYAPGGAHAVIAEFCCLVSRIPALYDVAEPIRGLARIIILQPAGLHHGAAERGRVLLILRREVVFADRLTDVRQRCCRFTLGMQDLPGVPLEQTPAERAFDLVDLIAIGNRRK